MLLSDITWPLYIILSFVICIFDKFDELNGIVKLFPELVYITTFTENVVLPIEFTALIIAINASLKLSTQQSAPKDSDLQGSWWGLHSLWQGLQSHLLSQGSWWGLHSLWQVLQPYLLSQGLQDFI